MASKKLRRSGRSNQYISKGERKSCMKTSIKDAKTRILNQLSAFREGRNVVLTIPNPNKRETNKRFIRVPAATVWKSR